MALVDDIKQLCDRLAPLGWREFLKVATNGQLDISQTTPAALRTELLKNLPSINRNFTGLEDFATDGRSAVAPGQPSLSLLYHVLASPLVVRDHLGVKFADHATPGELDSLENFIFSVTQVSLAQLLASHGGAANLAVAVFSTEYRPAADTVDGRHADLTFSRTGIARVGTAKPRYLPESRGFWPEDADNPHNIRVLPAKFSAWLAVKKKGSQARVSPILDGDGGAGSDSNRDFWIPIHKLFSGTECLAGATIISRLVAKLYNIKIQRVHKFLGTTPLPKSFPYVIEDDQIASFSTEPDFGAGWLTPLPRRSLVEPAIIGGQAVTYPVRPDRIDAFAAFSPRKPGVPEYVHARTRVTNTGDFEDLNDHLDVIAEMTKDPYDALHYIDFTGEGWVTAQVDGLAAGAPGSVPAFALVAAPDLFPSSGQFELSEWSRSNQVPKQFRDALWNVEPTPLSETRLPANLQLPASPFNAKDVTITAMVGMGAPLGIPAIWPVQVDATRTSHLPDDAAGVFAPGWDVAQDKKGGENGPTHLAAYALGSPFPEDAKLCAALSTFWPAVAPDVFRTFVNPPGFVQGSIAPMTDEEIGQHGGLPWDGIAGPREITVGDSRFIEFASFLNADYVRQSLQNRFSLRLTSKVSVEEYQSRMLAACRVYSVLANLGSLKSARKSWLMLSFRETGGGDPEFQRAQNESGTVLQGKIYSVRVCRLNAAAIVKVDARTERMPLISETRFFASPVSPMVISKRASDATYGASPSEG